MLGSIVGAVVEETETVGAEVDVEGEVLVDDASGLAPPPHAASTIEAASSATEVFFALPPAFTVPPAVMSPRPRKVGVRGLNEQPVENASYTVPAAIMPDSGPLGILSTSCG